MVKEGVAWREAFTCKWYGLASGQVGRNGLRRAFPGGEGGQFSWFVLVSMGATRA
jgi:hypothetical protein